MRSHANRSPGIVLFLLALLFLPASTDSAAPATDREPHDFIRLNRTCDWCHASVGVTTRGVMRRAVGRICAECHAPSDTQHPVEMEPAMKIPADLPLDHKGRLTCATCHNIHRSRFDPLTGEKTMYLRRDGSPRAFCEACHRNGVWRTADAAGER